MKNYVKPIVLANDEVSEGVYAGSGKIVNGGNDCYTVTANIHQGPETGRGDFRIQVNGEHAAADGHHSTAQILTLSFNQAVTYSSSNGTLVDGDNTNTISIAYPYHNNGNDYVGLGDVIVTADAGLGITGASLSCNYTCEQHDGLN